MGRRRQPFRHLTRLPVAAIVPPEGEAPSGPTVERLAQNLRRQGLREPVLVTVSDKGGDRGGDKAAAGYRLVVGRQRLAAARRLGWREIDVLLLDASFAAELAVIARLQAGQHDPWQLAETLQRLKERCGWTQAQVGVAIGRNRDFVAGLLAILDISPEARAFLTERRKGPPLSARHLRYLGRAPSSRQLALAREIVEQGLSTKVLEQRFRRGTAPRTYIKVRELRTPGHARGPRTTLEWRRYYRKLRTALRRVEEQETLGLRRSADQIAQARQRESQIRREARARRQALGRELRRATRQLTRRGAL